MEKECLFSVIVPTLNEAENIDRCISDILASNSIVEIIIADGGSIDNTRAIAEGLGATVIQTEPCRGLQCNCGAALASGEILVFLHADTILPDGAFDKLNEIFSRSDVKLGNFTITFDEEHWFLRLLTLLSRFDPGFFRFGDQGIVIRKSLFMEIGGFPDWSLFEDLAFIRKARKRTNIHRLPIRITTSACRFLRNGVIRQQLRNSYYVIQYILGISPSKIARKYYGKRLYLCQTSLVILARLPEPGKAKTRLAETLGTDNATMFYRQCAEDTMEEAKKLPPDIAKYIYYTQESGEGNMRQWAGPWFHYRPQVTGDLGKRLQAVFREQFYSGVKKVIVIATDVPDILADDIEEAVESLDKADLVLGPSFDGGYYLIGMNKSLPGLFEGVLWSTDVVYSQTISKARELGVSVACLRILDDIDNEDDLNRWQKRAGMIKTRYIKARNTESS